MIYLETETGGLEIHKVLPSDTDQELLGAGFRQNVQQNVQQR